MREIFTSGSTRGEWVAPLAGSPSLLLYRQRFVHFLNLRHKHGDMVWPAQFKGRAPEVPAKALLLTRTELFESEKRLAETCTFVGHFSGTDGAIVIGTDLKIKGFGAEIILDNARCSKVYAVRGPVGKTREEGDSESFGMRHRSAMRLCGGSPGVAVFVISQDGGVSLVWNEKGDCCYKSGIQTSNANMVLA